MVYLKHRHIGGRLELARWIVDKYFLNLKQ